MGSLHYFTNSPLFSPLHQAIWIYSYLLEREKIITHKKGRFLRHQVLTCAYDRYTGTFVDLLDPTNPRPVITKANEDLQTDFEKLRRFLNDHKIHADETQQIQSQLNTIEPIKKIIDLFGPLPLDRIRIVVYGETWTTTTPCSPSLLINDSGTATIAIPPCLFGLAPRILEQCHFKMTLPGISQKAIVAWPLTAAIYQIITGESHAEGSPIAKLLERLSEKTKTDLLPLCKDYVLGNPWPLLDFLDTTLSPLATALILLMGNYNHPEGGGLLVNRMGAIRQIIKIEREKFRPLYRQPSKEDGFFIFL